ncbi:MAG: efflux RND transporter periplasmic adaptor subunit [Acidobacteriia bacterium]|nr:efflux RND transporter periplasmic adaptor subunit [Terriglobia bacterium]
MSARRLIVPVVVLAVIGGIAWGTILLIRNVNAATTSETPTTRVKRGPVAMTVTARGELQGGKPEMLVAPMVGSDALTVTELSPSGDVVHEGDVVVKFDTTQQEYNQREAEADLAEAQQKVIQTLAENQASDEEALAAVNSAKTSVKVAELEVRRNQFLAAMKARDNEIALEALRNRLKQAEQDLANKKTTGNAALAIQRAGENKARTMAAMAQKSIESMTLKAKTSGYVNLQPNTSGSFMLTQGMVLPAVQIGDTVRPGMAVAQIPDMQNWEVSAKIAEVDRGHLAVGQAVTVAVVALARKTFPAHVTSLGNSTGQPWDRRFDCRMSLDQAGPELRPGMSSTLIITAEKLDDVLWVPSQALFERDGKSFVYLKTANGFTPRDVSLLKRTESQVVLTGLNEGDTVALSNPSEQNKPAAQPQSAMKAIPK